MLTEYGGFPPVPDVADEKTEEARVRAEQARHQDDDLHLRSCKAIMDYHIEASDGNIGHVAGLLVNEQTWAIRSMIVNTSNWWLGHNMLVAPQWITSIN